MAVEKPQKKQQIEPNSYVFVGPPQAGKTVFFAVGMKCLQRRLAKSSEFFDLTHDTHESCMFVDNVLSALSKGQWPPASIKPDVYKFRLTRKRHWMFFEKDDILAYHDFPGETFEHAFGNPKTNPADSASEPYAETLKNEVRQAKGVFLLIDSAAIFEGKCGKLLSCLFFLPEFLEKHCAKRGRKVAVIFTKSDLTEGIPDFDPVSTFGQYYLDAWIKLRRTNTEFFQASAVGKTEIDSDGNAVPPQQFAEDQGTGLLEPICWMLDIPNPDLPRPRKLGRFSENLRNLRAFALTRKSS